VAKLPDGAGAGVQRRGWLRRLGAVALRPQPKNASAQLAAGAAFDWVKLAVAAGFEPAEGRSSRAFEFCGYWFRHARLGPVAPEPRLGSPLRTPLNLHE
jgi:hypothetical protein